jgi:hypothetical protein
MRVLAAVLFLAACSQASLGDDDPDARAGDDDNEFGPDAADGPDTDPPTSTAQPPGGAYFNVPRVVIGANEAATIYYTIDGSTPTTSSPSGAAPLTVEGLTVDTPLRYFAVDAAGNTELAHDDLYTIDRDATLTISLANQTVTVTDAPAGLDLAGAVTYDGGTDTVTATLTVTNLEPRLLFHLKGMFAAPNQGTITADGTLAGTQFAYFGPEALDAGAYKTADAFTITGVNGAIDPITVDVTFRTDPTWVMNGSWDTGPLIVDSSNSGMVAEGNSVPFGFRTTTGDNHVRSAVLAPDGRYVYMGMRNAPRVVVKDLTTLQATIGADLDTGTGAVPWIEMSPDGGAIYALLLTGDHAYQRSGDNAAGCRGTIASSTTCVHSPPDLSLVKLRRADLSELARVPLFTDAADRHTRGGLFAISPDGTHAAVPINGTGRVVIVDLRGNMQVLQTVDISSRFTDAHSAAFSGDGARVFVVERGGTAPMVAIDTTTYALSDETPPTSVTHNQAGSLRRGLDGRIYFLRSAAPELAIYDPGDDSWNEVDLALVDPAAIAFPAASSYAIAEGSDFEVRSATNNVRLTLNADHSDNVGASTFGHVFLIGPE